jgi:hypothetical protein
VQLHFATMYVSLVIWLHWWVCMCKWSRCFCYLCVIWFIGILIARVHIWMWLLQHLKYICCLWVFCCWKYVYHLNRIWIRMLVFQGMLSVPGLFTIMSKVTELQLQVASWIGIFRAQIYCWDETTLLLNSAALT